MVKYDDKMMHEHEVLILNLPYKMNMWRGC